MGDRGRTGDRRLRSAVRPPPETRARVMPRPVGWDQGPVPPRFERIEGTIEGAPRKRLGVGMGVRIRPQLESSDISIGYAVRLAERELSARLSMIPPVRAATGVSRPIPGCSWPHVATTESVATVATSLSAVATPEIRSNPPLLPPLPALPLEIAMSARKRRATTTRPPRSHGEGQEHHLM